MVALPLWKVVLFGDIFPMNGSLVIMEGSSLLRFVTPMNGSLFIMEGSSLLRFLTPMNGSLVIIEGSLLLRSFSNEWYPCHYGIVRC